MKHKVVVDEILGAMERQIANDGSSTYTNLIEIELRMFDQVRTSEPSLCKDSPETFKVIRGMTHSVLSTKTLQSYLEDLQKAKAEGGIF